MVADHKGREHQGGMNPSASLIAGGGPLLPSAPAAACPQLCRVADAGHSRRQVNRCPPDGIARSRRKTPLGSELGPVRTRSGKRK